MSDNHSMYRFAPLILLVTTVLFVSGCGTNSQPGKEGAGKSSNSDSENAGGLEGPLDQIDWESLVGKEVTLSGELVVVDTYDLIRRGQVKIARSRLYIPTSRVDPNDAEPSGTSFEGGSNVSEINQAQKFNDAATIILDDGETKENIFPPTLFPELGDSYPTVRVGSKIKGVSGKVMKMEDKYVLVPDQPLNWTPAERPARPNVGNAKVTVASFNVLNYFTTIDDGMNRARGADSDEELKRQEQKLLAAILAMDADVVGLMELENNLKSEQRLVAALNQEIGKEVFKGSGIPAGFRDAPGGQNAIRVGIIYRMDRVEPASEISMIQDQRFDNARTPLVQSFKAKSSDLPFTLIVNHFKSKGGSRNADEANKNKGDGQGAYNAKRRSQALAICEFIDARKQTNAEPRVLVIGDLNAYGQEDPIDAMRAKGLIDLHEKFGGRDPANKNATPYSYIYYGQSGSLDHAMATKALASDVTGIATWHINADEPRFLDYNQEYNPKVLYEADAFRSSDHDPILIGIGK